MITPVWHLRFVNWRLCFVRRHLHFLLWYLYAGSVEYFNFPSNLTVNKDHSKVYIPIHMWEGLLEAASMYIPEVMD